MGLIEVQLIRLKKFLFFRFPKKEKTGFHFCNKAILIVAENAKIELDEFFNWADANRTLYFAEMLFAAYLVYCQENYQRPKFTKGELIYSFGLLNDEQRQKVIKAWANSERFAVKEGKKKAETA